MANYITISDSFPPFAEDCAAVPKVWHELDLFSDIAADLKIRDFILQMT